MLSQTRSASANNQLAPLDEIMAQQLKRGEIRLSGSVNTSMAEELAIQLRYLVHSKKQKHVNIYLNSPGGSIYDGLSVYDTIMDARKNGTKVDIYVSGHCMSMGAIILQAGTKRLSFPNTAFMLHELSMVNMGSLGELDDRHKQALRQQQRLDNIICKRTGMTLQQLRKLIARKDAFLDAEEALKHKIIDAVV